MNFVLMILVITLTVSYYLKIKEVESIQYDYKFMQWQAQQFSDKLKENKIEHEWG